MDFDDSGNIATRLVKAIDSRAAHERFAQCIARIRNLVPEAEVSGFMAWNSHAPKWYTSKVHSETPSALLLGMWPAEYKLDGNNEAAFCELVTRLAQRRNSSGDRADPLFRHCPECWLESLIRRDARAIDARLDPSFVYSQVPAFASSDRGMIDVLTCTVGGRLAILELKADEDIHLPLQGLDYWARVR